MKVIKTKFPEPVVLPLPTATIEIDAEEVAFLYAIVSRCGGNTEHSYRAIAERIYKSLFDIVSSEFKNEQLSNEIGRDMKDSTGSSKIGSIYFSDNKYKKR